MSKRSNKANKNYQDSKNKSQNIQPNKRKKSDQPMRIEETYFKIDQDDQKSNYQTSQYEKSDDII